MHKDTHPGNIKLLFRTVGVLSLVFLVLLIGVLIWVITFDLNTQITRIERLATQALARDVTIAGPLQLRPSLYPRLSIENVRIANPQWAVHADFISAEKLEIEIDLIALLQKQLVFEDIKLSGATINLQRDPEKGSNWDFKKPNNQPASPLLLPDLVELDAQHITVRYYPSDRPPVDLQIDQLHAALSRDRQVEVNLKSKFLNIPLNIDLQGGTFKQLINPDTRWPFKGLLETDTRKINLKGHITDLITFNDIELQISSNKQPPQNSILFGEHFEPLIEQYQVRLNIDNVDELFTVNLTAESHNFDLSRLYKPKLRTQKPSLKYQDFTIEAQGSGQSMTEILQSSSVKANSSNIVYRHPINQSTRKHYQAKIDALKFQSKKNAGLELALNGSANNIPFKARASTKELLSSLWLKKKTPINLNIESNAVTAQIKGSLFHGIKTPEFNGSVSMQAANLAKLGNLFSQSWLEVSALKARSHLKVNDHSIIFSNATGQLGSQKASGEIKLDYKNAFNLSIKAHANNVDIHKIFLDDKVPPELTLNLDQVSLNLHGKSPDLAQSLLEGNWIITANKGNAGWCAGTVSKNCLFDLHNILLTTQDDNPFKLTAQSLHNQISLKLNTELGRLKTMSKKTGVGASLDYHPLKINLNATDVSANFQGALHKPFENLTLLGDLHVNGELSSLAKLIDIPFKQQQKMSLSAHISTQPSALTLSKINAHTDRLNLKGKLNYRTTQSPKLTANVSGNIDLANYLVKPNQAQSTSVEKNKSDNRIIPKVSLDYRHLRSLDAFIKINDFSIDYNDTHVFTIDSQFTASNGVFKLGPSKTWSDIGNPPALSSIELDNSQQPTRARYTLQARDINYGSILRRLEVSNEISGSMDLNIDITGQGNTLRKAMETSNGELQIIANKGKVPRRLLELWGSGLIRSLFPTTLFEGSATDLNCAVADFILENGSMRSQALLTDTKRVTIAGEVVIDWKTEKIEGLFKPQPKSATLMHIGTPLRLTGTLKNSNISSAESSVVTLGKWAIGLSNPATIIVLFGDTGAKNKNPCEALLKD